MYLSKEKQTDISVVIPLYKGNQYCRRLLAMMEKNCLYEKLHKSCSVEVVFVNDYPDEKIAAWPEKDCFEARLVEQEANTGIHAARVKGILQSRGEYIIMLDQDDVVTDRWLYSQWNRIRSEGKEFCVCNGWCGRYRVLAGRNVLEGRVNDPGYYLSVGNAILSPGQVIMKRKAIPMEWLGNILKNNGADDFFLWVLALKQGSRFSVNDEHLYFHTPDRSADSVDQETMKRSLMEAGDNLERLGVLNQDELARLDGQINVKYGGAGTVVHPKFHGMFFAMYNWMRLMQKGIGLAGYFEKHGYRRIAVYGMGYLGECLCNELCGTPVSVCYGIDRSAIDFEGELTIFRAGDCLEEVDAVVVTAMEDVQEIRDMLEDKLGCPVITLPQVLTDLNSGLAVW